MANSKTPVLDGEQIELFQSSGSLNLWDANEVIPKGISPKDPRIEKADENLAYPVETTFRYGQNTYSMTIHPANVKENAGDKPKSHFCWTFEEKVEKAIIKIASSEALHIERDTKNRPIYFIETSFYQIRKEIADATSQAKGRKVDPKNVCSIKQLKKSLNILSMSKYEIVGYSHKEEVAVLSRLNGYYQRDDKLYIKLGDLIAQSISSGNWRAVDSIGILSSNSYYDIRMKTLLNTKFIYAKKDGKPFSPGLDYLIEYLSFNPSQKVKTNIQRIEKIINELPEVERVEVRKVMDGRKLISAVFDIYPSADFIQTMIENNVKTRRKDKAVLTRDDGLLIEPIREDFTSDREYEKALHDYSIKMEKHEFLEENKQNGFSDLF